MSKETKILISRSAFKNNINKIKEHALSADIIAVIKANAYGHGVKEILTLLQENNINKVAVAYIEEAIEIRNLGFSGKILVLVPIFAEKLSLAVQYGLEITIQNFSELEEIIFLSAKLNIDVDYQIFVDTGMHRDGFSPMQVEKVITLSQSSKHLKLRGILSHFSASDSISEFTSNQLQVFLKTNEIIDSHYPNNNFKKHISNSYAIFNHLGIPQPNKSKNDFNSVRPGISIHGLLSDKTKADEIGLIPTLTLQSNIIDIKHIKKGESAGYSFRYVAEKDHKIALIPIGYADGFRFHLSGLANVLIKGLLFKVIGSVCMDQIIVDLSSNELYNNLFDLGKIDDFSVSDEVVIIGKQSHNYHGNKFENEISAYDFAELLNTIPYEVFTSLSKRINRYIVE